jgi:hypothetical protein
MACLVWFGRESRRGGDKEQEGWSRNRCRVRPTLLALRTSAGRQALAPAFVLMLRPARRRRGPARRRCRRAAIDPPGSAIEYFTRSSAPTADQTAGRCRILVSWNPG